jgi:hypothetical protein
MIGGYKVYDQKRDCHVFLAQNPRDDGFEGRIESEVSLTQNGDVSAWTDGQARPQPFLAVSHLNPSEYRVFDNREPFDASQWRRLPGTWIPVANWPKYLEFVGE